MNVKVIAPPDHYNKKTAASLIVHYKPGFEFTSVDNNLCTLSNNKEGCSTFTITLPTDPNENYTTILTYQGEPANNMVPCTITGQSLREQEDTTCSIRV